MPKSPAAGTFAETPPLATPAEVAEYLHTTTAALAESLLRRGSDTDMQEAAAAIERLAAAPADEGLVMRDIWLPRLRALLARAHGDAATYAHFKDRYWDMAKTVGFKGHIAWAEAMP